MKEDYKKLVESLCDHIEAVVPYVDATLYNSVIGDKSNWFPVHSGRAISSRNQLNNMLIKARELKKVFEEQNTVVKSCETCRFYGKENAPCNELPECVNLSK